MDAGDCSSACRRPRRCARAAAGVDVVGHRGDRAVAAHATSSTREVRPALEALAALGPRIVQYKACSTADSSPTIGSLGRVIELARDVFGADRRAGALRPARLRPLHGVRPPLRRRGRRRATASTGSRRCRHHPSTPMTESDLAVHFSRQTELPIGQHAVHGIRRRSRRARAAPRRGIRGGPRAGRADDEHVALVAEAVVADAAPGAPRVRDRLGRAQPRASGARSVARATARMPLPDRSAPRRPVLAVSGSRSPQTPARSRPPPRRGGRSFRCRWATTTRSARSARPGARRARAGRSVAADDGRRRGRRRRRPRRPIAVHLSALVEAALRAGSTRRVIVCGGDTSSRVLGLLGAESLSIAANPVGNVVLCAVPSPVGLARRRGDAAEGRAGRPDRPLRARAHARRLTGVSGNP